MAAIGSVLSVLVKADVGAATAELRRFDRQLADTQSKASRKVQAQLGADFHPEAFRQYDQAAERARRVTADRKAFKAALGADYNPAGFRAYQRGIQQAEREQESLHSSAKKTFASLPVMAFAAGAAVGAALVEGFRFAKDAVKDVSDLGAATVRLSAITGMDTKTASQWNEIAKTRHISAQALQMGFVTLARNTKLAEDGSKTATKAFSELGVSQDTLRSKDPTKIIEATAQGLSRVEDPARRAALAQQLFGRNARALLPVLSQGSEGVKEALDQTQKYGAFLDNSAAPSLKRAREAQHAWELALDGLKITFVEKVLPTLVTVGTVIMNFIGQMREGKGAGGDFARILKGAFELLKPVFVTVGGAVKNFVDEIQKGKGIGGTFAAGMKIAFDVLKVAVQVTATALKIELQIIRVAFTIVFNAIKAVVNDFKNAFRAAVTVVGLVIAGAKAAFNGLRVAAIAVFNAVKVAANAFRSGLVAAFNGARSAAQFLLNVFRSVFGGISNAVRACFNAIRNIVNSILRPALNAVVNTARGAFNAVVGAARGLGNTLRGVFTSIWDTAKKIFRDSLNFIVGLIHSMFGAMANAGKGLMNALKNGIGSVWQSIKDLAKRIVNSVVDVVKSAWNAMFNAGKYILGAVESGFKAAVNGVLGTITGFLNKIIDLINKIPGVHVGHVTAPKLAQGGVLEAHATGGKITRPMAIVGEEAPRHPEYVIATNPAYRTRNLGLLAQANRALGMPGFAAGGVFNATAYGPPWGGIEGGGTTATGINLSGGPVAYIVAVDPRVIPLHSKMKIWPNPFNYQGDFAAEDTGGAIKGNRLDFYDWMGRAHQNAWGFRPVNVGSVASGPGFFANLLNGVVGGVLSAGDWAAGILGKAWQGITSFDPASVLKKLIGAVPKPDLPDWIKGLPGWVLDKVSHWMSGKLTSLFASQGAAGGGVADMTPRGPTGVSMFMGIEIANWVIGALQHAIQKGVAVRPTSGYRPGFDPHTATGTSEHQGTQYPHGAVDFGDFNTGGAMKRAVVAATQDYKYPLLNPIGFHDEGHASGTGHRRGGIIGIPSFAQGGVVPGPAGKARLVLAHGGETVLPATHRGGALVSDWTKGRPKLPKGGIWAPFGAHRPRPKFGYATVGLGRGFWAYVPLPAPKLRGAGAIYAPSGPKRPADRYGYLTLGLGRGYWEYLPKTLAQMLNMPGLPGVKGFPVTSQIPGARAIAGQMAGHMKAAEALGNQFTTLENFFAISPLDLTDPETGALKPNAIAERVNQLKMLLDIRAQIFGHTGVAAVMANRLALSNERIVARLQASKGASKTRVDALKKQLAGISTKGLTGPALTAAKARQANLNKQIKDAQAGDLSAQVPTYQENLTASKASVVERMQARIDAWLDILKGRADIATVLGTKAGTGGGGDGGGGAAADQSAQIELLTQLLQQQQLTTAVSEAQFKALQGFPPFGGAFQTGGVVPGPLGAPRTIIAHGGETVGSSDGAPEIHLHFSGDVRWLERFVTVQVERTTRRDTRMGSRALPGAR